MIPSTWHNVSAWLNVIAHLISWTIILGLVCVAAVLSYRLVAHPLAGLPGPKLAALSNIWLAYHIRNGRSVVIGRYLHDKYGSVVRVGPNEVWFNSKEAFRSIYSHGSRFEKSDFYLATALPRPDLDWRLQPISIDSLDLLSERDMKRYRRQRRAVGPVYQSSNLVRYESAIDGVLARVIERLQGLDGSDVDLKEWMHMIAVECLGATVLSWSPGMLKRGTDSGTSHHAYLSWRRKSVFGLFPTLMKLAYIFKPLDRVFSVIWGITYKPPRNFRTFFPDVGKRVSKRINMALHRQSKPGAHHDLMADLIDLHNRKPEFNETYLKRMAVTNFGAGHETLAATLTSTFTLLASHPEAYAAVAAEIRSHRDARIFSELNRLPQMQASIQEAKRLRPVIGMSLSRTVPHGGVHLHGHFLPAGTTVGCNPTALHCNPDICGSEPQTYSPDRWLLDPAAAREMEAFSLSWGGGSRTCPGRHLAELIVFKTVSALVQRFEVAVTVPEESEMPSYFMSMPTGVRARFKEAREQAP